MDGKGGWGEKMGREGVPNTGSDNAIAAVTAGNVMDRCNVNPIFTVVLEVGMFCNVTVDAGTKASCSREDKGVVLVTLRLVPVPTTGRTPTTERYLPLAYTTSYCNEK